MQLAMDLQFRPAMPMAEAPQPGSQQAAILNYLQAGHSLTVGEAMSQLGVYALSQRCGELRRMGWPIKSEPVVTANGKRIARYSLGAEQ